MHRFAVLAAASACVVLLAGSAPALGDTSVLVPAGTEVLLKFDTPVDSQTTLQGTTVQFEVASDVVVDRAVVLRAGTSAHGIVTAVSQPGLFGKGARVHVDSIQTATVDGRPLQLSPVDVTPDTVRQIQGASRTPGTGVAGIVLLWPIGFLGGSLVHGGQVQAPAGAVVTVQIPQAAQVDVPSTSVHPIPVE
ncbi:MAG TPA: hypothetical protein VEP50_08130 [bacterium]|nr:hypothetical protein [bacterium]